MKISKYTFTLEHEGKHYVYNTLSNALIELDEEIVNNINLWQKQKSEIKKAI